MSSKSVILQPGSPKPDPDIGRLLASHLDLCVPDAVARVRYGGGIVVPRCEAAEADTIVRELAEIDVRAAAVPVDVLEGAPRGVRATALEFLDKAISAVYSAGRELVVLDSDLRGIHVHAFAADSEPDAPSGADDFRAPLFSAAAEGTITGRARKVLDWIEESGKPAPRFVLTLYACEPAGPIRFDREGTDYSMLGEHKLQHSLDNFIALAELLATRFPDLLNRERVLGFIERLDPAEIMYFKREEAQRFDRWIQAWIRLEERQRVSDPHAGRDPDELAQGDS